MDNTNNPTTNQPVKQPLFDASDIDYLVSHLTLPQLRTEIHSADIKFAVSAVMDESPNYYWQDLLQACRMAATIKRSLIAATTPRAGNLLPDIAQVKAQTDMVNVIGRFTELRKSGERYLGRCPLHDDKNPSLTVYPEDGRWWCFGCNLGGDVIDFIEQTMGLDTREAINYLGGGNRGSSPHLSGCQRIRQLEKLCRRDSHGRQSAKRLTGTKT